MTPSYSIDAEGQMVALGVIGWIVAESRRAERFLSLSGLDSAQLRAGLEDRAVLLGALDFLMGNEADLIACAAALERDPAEIVTARERLAR